MSVSSNKRSDEFLAIASQFSLGALTTEASHPITANLSDTAAKDVSAGLDQLFAADEDVLKEFDLVCGSGLIGEMHQAVLAALKRGGKIYFTGCGSTGRLSILLVSMWRHYWQRQAARIGAQMAQDFERHAISVMAGGDYALIKSVEGFEDFAEFGRRQLRDLGVAAGDVVFAITEGGETSFVIGTAWKGLEVGARVFFVYNNPDEVLCQWVERSRKIIEEPRIEKVNLTTGPMSITGSTRMQATSIQLCVLATVLEMVVRDLLLDLDAEKHPAMPSSHSVPEEFRRALAQMHAELRSPRVLKALAAAVTLEESVYRFHARNNYFADRFAIDVLTDTTERSPTFCTPPFRKFDDSTATESWSFLFLPRPTTPEAWQHILRRNPACVEWTESDVREMVEPGKVARTCETLRKITRSELMKFKIGLDGLECRPSRPGDSVVAVVSETERDLLLAGNGFFRQKLKAAARAEAKTGLIVLGSPGFLEEVEREAAKDLPGCVLVPITVPSTGLLLDGVMRVGLKLLLNALSTCTMVRLGRVMGNCMVWVVPSNLKLIDRSTRYIQRLANLDFAVANKLLFEVIEYVEPRMRADQAYPPVVGLAVLRARQNLTNEEAEKVLNSQ